MKLINQSAQYLPQQAGIDGIYKQIELAGRTSYLSWDKMTDDSAKKFVDMLIKSKHCYTEESEVLTETGWCKWKNYSGQKVAVVNKDKSFKGFEYPVSVIEKIHSGIFYEYPSLGLTVTDGHKMFGLHRLSNNNFYNNNNYYLFKCNEVYIDNNGRTKTNGQRLFKIPNSCNKQFTTSPFHELIGFWIGDGIRGGCSYIKFHLKKQRKIDYLKTIVSKCGFDIEERKNGNFIITSSTQKLGLYFNKNFVKNEDKFIDGLDYSPIEIHSIIKGLLESDSNIHTTNSKTIFFSTTSKYVSDWIQKAAPIGGYAITCSECHKHNINQKDSYNLHFLDAEYSIVNDTRRNCTKVRLYNDSKKVYCVETSTGIIIVRGTNGIVSLCGNCSVLEHGTVYLNIPITTHYSDCYNIYLSYPTYCRVSSSDNYDYLDIFGDKVCCKHITTNLRFIQEHDLWDDFKELICEPTEFHEKRLSVKVITDIGVTREFNRHRTFSIVEQSTRYCNFSKDKFGNEITFIIPVWFKDIFPEGHYEMKATCFECNGKRIDMNYMKSVRPFLYLLHCSEDMYFRAIEYQNMPQQARQVLPLSVKTEVVYTAFESDWRHFFDLRLFGKTGEPHPQMKQLAELIKQEFEKAGVWEGIMKYPSKYE